MRMRREKACKRAGQLLRGWAGQGDRGAHSVGGDALEPVIVEVEEDHLWLCGLEDEVSKLLHLEASLEGQLQLTALDHDVGEIQQVDLLHSTTQAQGKEEYTPTLLFLHILHTV